MVVHEQLRELKALVIKNGWDPEFWDDDEERMFDTVYESVVKKFITVPGFAAAAYGEGWEKKLKTQRKQKTAADQVKYMYENRRKN